MALGANLPTWPALVFTYIEPITTLLGCHAAYTDPAAFVSRQLPVVATSSTHVPQTAILLSYSIASIFLLLALLNVLCTAVTRDIKTTRYFLAILMVGDVGHIWANYKGMGADTFWKFGDYNEVMVGNVWITVFLFVNRLATVSGVFGGFGKR